MEQSVVFYSPRLNISPPFPPFSFSPPLSLCSGQLLQDELAERSVQLEKVRRAGRELANTQESPTLRAAEITSTAGMLAHNNVYCFTVHNLLYYYIPHTLPHINEYLVPPYPQRS